MSKDKNKVYYLIFIDDKKSLSFLELLTDLKTLFVFFQF